MDIDASTIWIATRSKEAYKQAVEAGVRRELFNGAGKTAWKFVSRYLDEHGDVPGSTLITEQTGLVMRPVDDEDPVTLSYLVEQLNKRSVFKALNYGIGRAYEFLENGEQDDAVSEVLKLSDHLREELSYQSMARPVSEVVEGVLELYEKTKKGEVGVPFPWDSMTRMTLGMWPETLTFFVARPGVGKTWTAILIAMHAWSQGLRVLVVSPEMNRFELGERIVSKYGRLNYGHLVSAKLGVWGEDSLRKTVEKLKEVGKDFWILDDEERLHPSAIERSIDAVEPHLLVMDSIYMLRVSEGKVKKGPGSKGGRYDRILDTVDWLRSMSRRKKIPILGISQLSREGKVKQGAVNNLKKGRGTGGLEDALAMTDTILWDVHNLFAVWQDADMRKQKELMFVPLKARRQATMSTLVVRWDMENMNFDEIGTEVTSIPSGEDDDDDGYGDSPF